MSAQRLGRMGLVLLVTAACSTNRPSTGPQVGSAGQAQEIQIQNGTGYDLRITAMYGSVQTPIGTVRAMETRSMRLPPGASGAFRLAAEPPGGGMANRLFSEVIVMASGQRVTWELRATGGAVVTYGAGGPRAR